MKLPEKKELKKQKSIKKPITKPEKEKVLLVAQEFQFARKLSGNDKKTRDRVLKTFKKWILKLSEKGIEFTEDSFVRIWRGLFYAVWMSDKPLIQEELCDNIAGILDLFSPNQIESAMRMSKAGFKVLAKEWYGIDQHRLDKFLMLVRRYLRGSIRCLLRCDWSLESCKLFSDMLSNDDGLLALKTPMYARNALSMVLHIVDCYLEELSKVSKGVIPDESLVCLLQPFLSLVCGARDDRSTAARRLLTALVRQSELGLEYDSKTRAWQRMGCPAGGPDALELASDDDADDEADDEQPSEDMEEAEDGPLDPRAGRVHVNLRPLPVPAGLIAAELRRLLAGASSKAYTRARICAERFEELAKNNYPLKVPDTDVQGLEPNLDRSEPMRAASRLHKLEKTLINSSDELALRGLSRKHRKRLLARSRAGLSLVDETAELTESTNGGWQVETAETDDSAKNNQSNKENKAAKKKNRKRKHRKEDDAVQNNKKPKTDKNEANTEINKVKTNEKHINNKKNKQKNEKQKLSVGTKSDTILKKDAKVVNKKKLKKDKGKNQKEETTKVLSVKNENNKKNNAEKIREKLGKNESSKQIHNTEPNKEVKQTKVEKNVNKKSPKSKEKVQTKPTLVVTKVKNYQKQVSPNTKKDTSPKKKVDMETPKKVKFVLKNNCMQGPVDYYKSVRQSPNIPFDSSKQPSKTNLKPSTPSPINPFFKKKLKLKKFQ
ncbi:unnamed protein product [Euphydryas editha]|uniref:Ribosomal RNA processing protein 1 homolog n=1 Tax=Euphydryas editha TaxID=104508 RepID=A0AAU9UYJ7_EUPED|nr:unnamed protein product [Euphydryas editha]